MFMRRPPYPRATNWASNARRKLFGRLAEHTDEIRKLKAQLRQVALDALKPNR
jgi:hypothetical protein